MNDREYQLVIEDLRQSLDGVRDAARRLREEGTLAASNAAVLLDNAARTISEMLEKL